MKFLNDGTAKKWIHRKKQVRKQRTIDGIKFVAVRKGDHCYVTFPGYDADEPNKVYRKTTDLEAAIQDVYEDVLYSFATV
jgi:hypothetical protein